MFRIGDKVRHKVGGDIGTIDRVDLGPGMHDLILVRFHQNGVPAGDGYCIPRAQLELVKNSPRQREGFHADC